MSFESMLRSRDVASYEGQTVSTKFVLHREHWPWSSFMRGCLWMDVVSGEDGWLLHKATNA